MKALILGGGFAGTTTAHLLKREGWDVTLIEKEPHLGGGCRTFFHCGHPYTNGPRVYYGYSQKVFDWLNSVVPIRRFPFELRTLAHEPKGEDRRFWTYPPHEMDLGSYPRAAQIAEEMAARDNSVEPKDFEDYYLRKVGPTIYDMFVDHYSKKMWMIGDNRIFDIFKWSAKDRPIETGSREAYKGSILGYPIAPDGYNAYFERMVEGTRVFTGHHLGDWADDSYNPLLCEKDGRFHILKRAGAPQEIVEEIVGELFDVVVSTLPIDELLGIQERERLPYAGRDFHVVVLPCKQVFPGDVRFCHYASPEDEWTRITEFKKITYHESESTLLVLEKPSRANKLYPYLTKANMAKVAEYLKMLPPNVHSIGRLGTYKYSTIEQTIAEAFAVVAKITGKSNPMEGQFFGIGDTSLMKGRKE